MYIKADHGALELTFSFHPPSIGQGGRILFVLYLRWGVLWSINLLKGFQSKYPKLEW